MQYLLHLSAALCRSKVLSSFRMAKKEGHHVVDDRDALQA